MCVNYCPDKALRLINPGYGWKVEMNATGTDLDLSGGPLEGNYRMKEFHCHWGSENHVGSEHTVDGRSFAGELHLVHWNYTKYPTFQEAAAAPDGLAVLGVFLKVGSRRHEELAKVVSLLANVQYKGDTYDFPGELDPNKLLPADKTYWTYLGSLTTPPCTESVTWIVFKEPIEVSQDQLDEFRNLRSFKHGTPSPPQPGVIANNYRPPCPLYNRELRECGCA